MQRRRRATAVDINQHICVRFWHTTQREVPGTGGVVLMGFRVCGTVDCVFLVSDLIGKRGMYINAFWGCA